MDNFTRREKHVLAFFVALLIPVFIFGKTLPDLTDYEILYLFAVVTPVGLYLATDPERIGKPK
jgi:hypothetical protein